MKHIIITVIMSVFALAFPDNPATDIDKSFKIYTSNIQVKSVVARTLDMETSSNEYKIMLVPQEEGHVAFAITNIKYRGTINVSNLRFRVEVKGFIQGVEVAPIFSVDGNNRRLNIDENSIIFRYINGSIPVWFEQAVDSVKLSYSNSHGLDLVQYVHLEDLRVIPHMEIVKNPELSSIINNHNIMVAVDGSSSVTRKDRRLVYRELKSFFNKLHKEKVDSQINLIEYGTGINQFTVDKGAEKYLSTLKDYKKRKSDDGNIKYTNWVQPLEKAIKEKPDVIYMITDGWSNYFNDQPSHIFEHFTELIILCNKLKSQGTRIVFITSEMHAMEKSGTLLPYLIDGKNTQTWNVFNAEKNEINPKTELLILKDFSTLKSIDLVSLLPIR